MTASGTWLKQLRSEFEIFSERAAFLLLLAEGEAKKEHGSLGDEIQSSVPIENESDRNGNGYLRQSSS